MSNAPRFRVCTILFVSVSYVAGMSGSTVAQAASLHFVLFAETLDTNIGTGADYTRSVAWADTIASNTGLELSLHTLKGTDLTPAKARQMLAGITPDQDDVVCFIYTGHGANAGDSDWPTFTFLTLTGDPYVSFDEVVSILQPKAQRMLLVMADCCNVPFNGSGRVSPLFEPSGASALTIANYKRLFLDFRGTVRATAAEVGQYSLGGTDGGVFLNAFLDDLNTLANTHANLTWSILLNEAADDAKNTASYYITMQSMGIAPQEAHFVIEAEQVAGAVPDDPTTTDPGDSTGSINDSGDSDTTNNTDTANTSGQNSSNADTSMIESTSPTGAGCGAFGPGMFGLWACCWVMLMGRRSRRSRT